MSDRHDWIERRAEDGYDFADLFRAMSQLIVYGGGGEVTVDASAIMAEHAPTVFVLRAGPDGLWSHHPSGTHGPLVECLATIALIGLEADAPYTPTP